MDSEANSKEPLLEQAVMALFSLQRATLHTNCKISTFSSCVKLGSWVWIWVSGAMFTPCVTGAVWGFPLWPTCGWLSLSQMCWGESPLLWSSPYLQSHLAKLSAGLDNLTLSQASSGLTLFSAAQGTNHVVTLKLFW